MTLNAWTGYPDPKMPAQATTENERAAFEAIASDNGKWPQAVKRDANGNYQLLTTASGWEWWQAARRAPADTPWHQAVLEACMLTEACYEPGDPRKSIEQLIDWHLGTAKYFADQRAQAVRQAVRDYHFALDSRQHGDIAAGRAMDVIQDALGMPWVQGVEAAARAEQPAPERQLGSPI